jgi:predicted DNA-binding protein
MELTKEEAEAYLAELDDFELDDALLRNVAGGQKCNSQNSCPDNKPLYS